MNAAQLFVAIVSVGVMAAPFGMAVHFYRCAARDRWGWGYGHGMVAVGVLAVFWIGSTGARLIHSLGTSQ